MKQNEIEKIDLDVIHAMKTTVRQKTWVAVDAIKNIIQPYMTEKEAIKKANEYLVSQGVKKFWHKTHIRFGESTILSFNDPYKENVTLKENDIFYIDIGPIWDGIEGDCGDTFVMGNNLEYLKIKTDIKNILNEVRQFWLENKDASGVKLSEVTQNLVEKNGYVLFPAYVKGHRLSEFSHQKYADIGTFQADFKPSADRWILELQICHPSLKFGAFYEDLLSEF